MIEILAVFRSRSQAMDCNTRLRRSGIPSNLINTPKEAGVGCGLSVKFPKELEMHARAVVTGGRYSAFYGFMTKNENYGRISFKWS